MAVERTPQFTLRDLQAAVEREAAKRTGGLAWRLTKEIADELEGDIPLARLEAELEDLLENVRGWIREGDDTDDKWRIV